MTKIEDAARLCMCHNLRKTSRAITQFYDRMLEPSGLAITQFSLLVGLSVSKSPTITRLAKEMIIDRTTLTRNLSILQNRGLIKIIEKDGDKRLKYVVVTNKGKEILSKALSLWEKAQLTLAERFGKENCNDMLLELSKLIRLIAA